MPPAEPTGEVGPDIDDTVIVERTADDHTRIVQRANDDHTRRVVRQPPTEARNSADPPPEDEPTADQAEETTVQSSRGSTATDTLLSGRRAAAPVHTPVVDSLQRRYQPPQVQSGASVRYAARPTPTIISPRATVSIPDVLPDPARLLLADAAAEIRQRAEVTKRRRRRFTLIAIISSTLLVVLAAAAYTVFTIFTW